MNIKLRSLKQKEEKYRQEILFFFYLKELKVKWRHTYSYFRKKGPSLTVPDNEIEKAINIMRRY